MKLAIVGATGLVGKMMLKVLNERKIPISELHLFASSNSAGTSITFRDKKHIIKILSESSMTIKYDYILMSAGSTIAKNYAPIASKFNNTIIDNSSAFRRDSSIPLVIPEVNYESLRNYNGIIANPNCSTIQMVLSLHNLHKKYRLTKIIVSTYQAVSGAGKQAIDSLKNE
ncbi:MAG: Asd/ArgC dimerization domain-containing protein, partial [Candidatus Cloacimonadota bacterium]|nr:Asd/ArgC dimerization domain-containing protein [Candidatus Cloacimonadota bacterium]